MSVYAANTALVSKPRGFFTRRLVIALQQLIPKLPQHNTQLTTQSTKYYSTYIQKANMKYNFNIISRGKNNNNLYHNNINNKNIIHINKRNFANDNKAHDKKNTGNKTFSKIENNKNNNGKNNATNSTTTTTPPPAEPIKPVDKPKVEPKQPTPAAAVTSQAKVASPSSSQQPTQPLSQAAATTTNPLNTNIKATASKSGSSTQSSLTSQPTITTPPKQMKTPFVPRVRTVIGLGFTLFVMFLITDDFNPATIKQLSELEPSFLLSQSQKAVSRGIYLIKAAYSSTYGRLDTPQRPSSQQSLDLPPMNTVTTPIITTDVSAAEIENIPTTTTTTTNSSSNNAKSNNNGDGVMAQMGDFGNKIAPIYENVKFYSSIAYAHSMSLINRIADTVSEYNEKKAQKKVEEQEVAKKQKMSEDEKIRAEIEQRRENERLRHERLQREREEREKLRLEEENAKNAELQVQMEQDAVALAALYEEAAHASQQNNEMTSNINEANNTVDEQALFDAQLAKLEKDHIRHFEWEQKQLENSVLNAVESPSLPKEEEEKEEVVVADENKIAVDETELIRQEEERLEQERQKQLAQIEAEIEAEYQALLNKSSQQQEVEEEIEKEKEPVVEIAIIEVEPTQIDEAVVIVPVVVDDTNQEVIIVVTDADVIQSDQSSKSNDDDDIIVVVDTIELAQNIENQTDNAQDIVVVAIEEEQEEDVDDGWVEEFLPYPELPTPNTNLTSSRMLETMETNEQIRNDQLLPDRNPGKEPTPPYLQNEIIDPIELVRDDIYTEPAPTREELKEAYDKEQEKIRMAKLEEEKRHSVLQVNGVFIDVDPERKDWVPPENLKSAEFKLPEDLESQLHRITSLLTSYDARLEWQQAHEVAIKQGGVVLTQAEREMRELSEKLNDKLTSYQLQREDLIFDLHKKIINYDQGTERMVVMLEQNDADFFTECRQLIVSYTQSALNAAIASTRIANEQQAIEYATRLEQEVAKVNETVTATLQLQAEHQLNELKSTLEEQYNLDLFQLSMQHAKDVDALQDKYLTVIDTINNKVETLADAITAQLQHQEQLEQVQKITVALVEAERLLGRGQSLAEPLKTLQDIAKYDQTLDNILSTISDDVIDNGVAPIYHIQQSFETVKKHAHRYAYLPPRSETLAHVAAAVFYAFTFIDNDLVQVPETTPQDDENYPTSISQDVVNESFFNYLRADQARLRRAGYYFDRADLNAALDEMAFIKNPHVRIQLQPVVIKVRDRLALDQTLQVLKAHSAALRTDIQRAQIEDL